MTLVSNKVRTFVNACDVTPGVPKFVGDTVLAPRVNEQYVRNLRSGGVDVVCITVVGSERCDFECAVEKTIRWRKLLERLDGARLATSVAGITQAKSRGEVSFVLATQNPSIIEDSLEFLEAIYLLGFRVLQLTYQRQNLIGAGCGEPSDGGLSTFGKAVVREMNSLGMLVDVSHCGRRTTLDAIELSQDPIVITHGTVKELGGHSRAKDLDVIGALAEKGGVIGVCILSQYLRPDGAANGTNLDDYLDHVDYLVDHVGIDHVGIGMDNREGYTEWEYDAFTRMYPDLEPRNYHNRVVAELQDVSNAWMVVSGLRARGYTEEQIDKIVGGNFMRVFEQVWRHG